MLTDLLEVIETGINPFGTQVTDSVDTLTGEFFRSFPKARDYQVTYEDAFVILMVRLIQLQNHNQQLDERIKILESQIHRQNSS